MNTYSAIVTANLFVSVTYGIDIPYLLESDVQPINGVSYLTINDEAGIARDRAKALMISEFKVDPLRWMNPPDLKISFQNSGDTEADYTDYSDSRIRHYRVELTAIVYLSGKAYIEASNISVANDQADLLLNQTLDTVYPESCNVWEMRVISQIIALAE